MRGLHLRERLRACFRRWSSGRAYGPAGIVLGLILHLVLGFRQLRDSRYYRDDPMVHRVLGVRRLPDVATVSRILAAADGDSVAELQDLCRQLVVDRLAALGQRRVTLDFDGSVIRTGRWAEGTAVGYNRAKKGQRSYYPLFCTVAQTGDTQLQYNLLDPQTEYNGAPPNYVEHLGDCRSSRSWPRRCTRSSASTRSSGA